ncbi:hypothetical protein BSKO_08780 [Bryopsis sp. KO-2023]|nr:hypothetical protein BSKO_08780 [Bryopsis sp. KO-2023]
MEAEKEFDPSSWPGARLYSHVLQKGWQAGGTIGVAVVAPIAAFGMYRSGKSFDVEKILTLLGRSAGVGVGLSGLMCTAKYVGMDQDGLEDRVYRLHYNEGQNRVDQFAGAGTFLGGLLAASFVSKVPAVVLGGGAAGAFAGVLAHIGTKRSKED